MISEKNIQENLTSGFRRAATVILVLTLLLVPAGCSQWAAADESEHEETKVSGSDTSTLNVYPESEEELSNTEPSTAEPESIPADEMDLPELPDENDTAADDEKEEQKRGSTLDASGFVLLSDAVPDVILEIRYYSTYNFVGTRIDGYEEPVALLTVEAAEALQAVSNDVMELGYRLKIYDAYRPTTAVAHFVRWAEDEDDTKMKEYFYPELSKTVLFSSGYISSHSGHSRGSTVDLTLFDMNTGKEVDMGGTFDYFGELSHSGYTETLTDEQISNRAILRDAMLRHGFRSISTEWWHYTLIEEPYPDTYFDFPVSREVLSEGETSQ